MFRSRSTNNLRFVQACMAGIVFAKFTKPTNRAETILFSTNALITLRNGSYYLLCRIGDMRYILFMNNTMWVVFAAWLNVNYVRNITKLFYEIAVGKFPHFWQQLFGIGWTDGVLFVSAYECYESKYQLWKFTLEIFGGCEVQTLHLTNQLTLPSAGRLTCWSPTCRASCSRRRRRRRARWGQIYLEFRQ